MRDRLNLSRLSIASVTDVGRSHAIRWLSPSISTSSIRNGEAADRGGIADTVVITEKGVQPACFSKRIAEDRS